MIWWASIALAQDCRHTLLMEQRAAAWSAQSPEYRALERQKRHEISRFLKDLFSSGAPTGEQKAEVLVRLSALDLEEGIDQLMQGQDGLSRVSKSRKQSVKLHRTYPMSVHADRARALEVDALIWLGLTGEALKRKPTDPHQQADLLWSLGRFDEACAIHPEDDPPVSPHPMLIDLHAAHAAFRQGTDRQIAWLREHSESDYAQALWQQWWAADNRDGLATWYALFPEDSTRKDLSVEQISDLATHPELGWDDELTRIRGEHADTLAVCQQYSVAVADCLEGDPAAALVIHPLLDQASDGLLACLDAEVFWQSHAREPSSWEQAALGELASCAVRAK